MRPADFFFYTLNGLLAHRLRSFLTILGISVGIGAVALLTSLGEGLHHFVLSEFTQFGTNLITVNPGKVTTHGISGALISNVRPLTIEDSEQLKQLPHIIDAVAYIQGNAAIESGGRQRRCAVYGVSASAARVWNFAVASGRFLPDDPPRAARSFVVLGSKVRQELFGNNQALGMRVRIGSELFRVIGSMESKGQLLGFDLDDAVYIPTSKAMSLFNRESLMGIDLLHTASSNSTIVAEQVKKLLLERHGKEDFSIITQEKMLETLGDILGMLTIAVGALGGISLVVGGVGILTIMSIAVNERTGEIGLLRALGIARGQILLLFLGEALLLAAIGGLLGLGLGLGGSRLLSVLIPDLPARSSWAFIVFAELLAMSVGLLAGVLPARKAATMHPVEALRAE